MPRAVVLDTSVLFPPTLRDTLLRCAELDLYLPLWSPHIVDELRRNLITDAGLAAQRVDRLILAMNRRFPEALVDSYQQLMPTMTNHPKDRHVLAAAVQAKANLIVTLNLKDFSTHHLAPHGIDAQLLDEFLIELATASFDAMRTVIEMQASGLQKPPQSVGEILAILEGKVPTFAGLMRHRMLVDQL